MINEISLHDFLIRNNISDQQWELSGCEWENLLSIGRDHEENFERLRESAEFFAKVIQKFKRVHSVRWRVKDTEHLLEKIVRKRADGAEKYLKISSDNYFDIVTDLVGIRALHLFKEDCFDIDLEIKRCLIPVDNPIAYIRAGDQDGLLSRFREHGFDIETHPAGYRSIHYIFSSQPLHRKVISEVQVRTIFEEGRSEIDHNVRYPNFSNDELVNYFLKIFNRMAGSADEMGGFVQGLALTLRNL